MMMKRFFISGVSLAALGLWTPICAAQSEANDETPATEKALPGKVKTDMETADKTLSGLEGLPKFNLREVWENVRISKIKTDPAYRIEVFQQAIAEHHDGDGKKAIRLFTDLAEHANHTESMLWLARMAFRGEAQVENPELAFEWSSKAAAQGHVQAMLQTAGFFYEGVGTPQSLSSARHWFLYAADRGSYDADEHLLTMYSEGKGGEANQAMAIVFGKRLAKRYKNPGLFYMGKAYRDGAGVEQDWAKAREYLQAATEYEYPGASAELEKLTAMETEQTQSEPTP